MSKGEKEEIENTALGWNDEISNDSPDFVILPEGDYNFEVIKMERKSFSGSEKMGACPQAEITLKAWNADDSGIVTHNLFLHKKTEGLLCEFFRGLGLRKHGEPLRMEWNKIIGCTGRCKIIVKEFSSTKKPGEKFKVNNVKKFLDPEEPEDDLAF